LSEFANLQIVNIPDDVEFEIEEYDGMEWVAEKHRNMELICGVKEKLTIK